MAPLHWVASRGNTSVVPELVKAGARLEEKDDRYGHTALRIASLKGTLQLLLNLSGLGLIWRKRMTVMGTHHSWLLL
jgi:ankyrin repeat protein